MSEAVSRVPENIPDLCFFASDEECGCERKLTAGHPIHLIWMAIQSNCYRLDGQVVTTLSQENIKHWNT
jgi:hypothetical protein